MAANALGAIAIAGEAAVHLQQYATIFHGWGGSANQAAIQHTPH